MPAPSTAVTILRPDLAGPFMQFSLEADRQGFIGLQVAPVIEVGLQASTFAKIKIAELLMNRDTLRAPGAGYSRSQFQFDVASWATKDNGAEEPVDDRQAQMYRYLIDAQMIAASRAQDAVLRSYEKRVSALIFNTTTWTGASLTTAVGTAWSTVATATPITDVEAAIQKVFDNSGLRANALVIGWKAFRNLRNNTTSGQIIDRIKFWGGDDPKAGNIGANTLARVFGLERVIVAGAVKNTAIEGQAASIAGIWDPTKAMVCKVATGPDIQEPCIARTFHWADDGSDIGATMESYRDEAIRGDWIRARMDTDEIVMYPQAGHLLTGV